MEKFENILEKVYLYYPKGLSYDSREYKNSKEHKLLKKKRKDALANLSFHKYILLNMQKIFGGYIVSDWTDFEDLCDYEYRILLHKNQPLLDGDIELMSVLGGERREIYFFISVLEKYYCYFIVQSNYCLNTKEWDFKNINDEIPEIEDNILILKDFFKKVNYTGLSRSMLNQKVPKIQTELTEMNNATIFDCLFNDLITP